MCGIVGRVNFEPEAAVNPGHIRMMADCLRHRGPDDEGVWTHGNVGLGHRRLSIIDLSPAGRNPMCNEDGTVWIVFNGEIYNFQELRTELQQKGHRFKSRSDTEVILHLYEEVGLECVKRLVGMFAFAIWDEKNKRLMLARDRMGKKPLVYSVTQTCLVFGSEIKALLRSGEVETTINPDSIHDFLVWQCIPSPKTAFKEIKKLPPASILVLEQGHGIRVERYWELTYGEPVKESEPEIVEKVLSLTKEATRARLVADVPVGIFLSGGVDSACILAAARNTRSGPIRTFSVTFGEQQFDESRYARLLSRYFETEHHEFNASPSIVELLSSMAELFDEPFADPSAVPTYYLSRLTREHVKVALSGDGGDEAFGGYERYFAIKMLGAAGCVPGIRHLVAIRSILPHGARSKTRHIYEILTLLGRTPEQQYRALFVGMMEEEQWKQGYTAEFRDALNGCQTDFINWAGYGAADDLSRAMSSDTSRYIPECLNVKVDIVSMACGLEVRSPFLDHRIVEFCSRIPSSMKLRGRTQKFILKQAFRDELPKAILQRGKQGFTVPLVEWFRHELKNYAYATLLSADAKIRTFVSPRKIQTMLQDHTSSKKNWHVQLWRLLVLESWLQATKDSSPAYSALVAQ